MELFTGKLGKLSPVIDERTLKLSMVLRALPPIPKFYDVDNELIKLPLPMFGNDVYGDCVIAGRAHMTLRFEAYEQKKALPITTKNVTDEYFKETGGADSGLYLLDSLKCWRNGWLVDTDTLGNRVGYKLGLPCCRKKNRLDYNIYAFGTIDYEDKDEVQACVYLLRGLYIGLALPTSAKYEKVWSSTVDAPASWGRHCVYIKSYNDTGLTCVTWGRLQSMTWTFFQRYCDEAYGVVDNKNRFTENSPVDVQTLSEYLKEIEAL
jgi:hypothetical protein